MNATKIYEFGDFVLDPAQRSLLRRDGAVVPINAKAFDALVCVVERAGQVVPRAALAEALWPTTIVEDNNLSQTVLALRRALGDDPDAPRYLVTVPRRGYQFVAAVRAREHGSGSAGITECGSRKFASGSPVPGVAGCSPALRLPPSPSRPAVGCWSSIRQLDPAPSSVPRYRARWPFCRVKT